MERTFLSHCAIFLFSFVFFFDLSFVSSSTRNIPKLFDTWCDEHGRKYSSEEEKSYRLKVFEDNYAFITQHNEIGNSTYKLALNEFADLTHNEFKLSRLGLRLSAVSAISFNKTKLQEPFLVRDIPASIDWSLKGAVTEVKDQGYCDASWAFAVTGAMEGINKIVTGDLVSLSEQELIDCDTFYNYGCLTGSVDNAYKFVTENHGLHTQEDYPYYGRDRSCYNKELAKPAVPIDGYANISANNEELILHAVARQPVSVGLCGSSRGFQFYHWGVFTGPCSNFLDHAALIVGYDSILGMDYWIVKNSWGQYWGMKGYILIQRNTGNSEGLCGINMMASYPIKTGPNPPPPPEPIYCNYFTYCLAGQTCCCGEKFLGICILWRCCVFDNAVCCEDMNSCCPPEYPICDTKSYRCLQRDGNATKNSSRKSSSRPSLDDIWIL